jgi:putative flippase GtrA
VRYVAIQVLAYGLDFGVFLLVLQTDLAVPIWANIFAKFVAGVFAFILHRWFTFRTAERGSIRQQAIRYFVLLAFNIPVASAILAFLLLLVDTPVAAKFFADIICVALTYALSNHFVFSAQSQGPASNKNTRDGV